MTIRRLQQNSANGLSWLTVPMDEVERHRWKQGTKFDVKITRTGKIIYTPM